MLASLSQTLCIPSLVCVGKSLLLECWDARTEIFFNVFCTPGSSSFTTATINSFAISMKLFIYAAALNFVISQNVNF